MNTFTAIDFETATGYMDSACAIGIITVENGGSQTNIIRSYSLPKTYIGIQISKYMESLRK